MKLAVVTLFPEFFTSPLGAGLLGKAIASEAVEVDFIDPRTHTTDKHRTVDDSPYGGGAGMVMKPEPLVAAIRDAKSRCPGPVVLLTPQGRPLAQTDLLRWSSGPGLVLVAGRYEGFDERIRSYVDEEISMGDYVLTGGEYAALTVIDGVVRLLPGTVGNERSVRHDSFAQGLLEHPQYTRPEEYEGARVPDVLLSGHHENIDKARLFESLARTRARRPDLLRGRPFGDGELALMKQTRSSYPPIELCVVGTGEEARWGALAEHYGISKVSFVPSDVSSASEAIDEAKRRYRSVRTISLSARGADTVEGCRALARTADAVLVLAGAGPVEADAVLGAPRAWAEPSLDPLLEAAIQLDRLIGEG